MTSSLRPVLLYLLVAALIAGSGVVHGPNTAMLIINMGLISAIMALGVNLQWGFAGLFNIGIMGFVALGGLATVLVATPPVTAGWSAGGLRIMIALALGAATVVAAVLIQKRMAKGMTRTLLTLVVLVGGFFLYRAILDPGVDAVEAIHPASAGNLGGLGLPVLLAWPMGGVLAAGAAWIIGKTALGLRSDYLAIATLGIGEIIVAVMRNEEWLARGVKNVSGIPRPVPYELDLQADPGFIARAAEWGMDPATASAIWVKLLYAALFTAVLLLLILMSELALKSPWGRMMRAIRDNETAAEAMGKNVTRRHLQIFVIGSAVIGLAGAMMVTLDGLLSPNSFNPLRYTFLIWVMVIVGGSGNNWGAVLGAILIWFLWIKAEVWGPELMRLVTAPLPDGALREHLLGSAPHMRFIALGLVLLLVLRFAPRGLVPER
jgi:branched-chain amino acid transport system permease protein